MPRARLRVHRAGKKFNLAGACRSLRKLANLANVSEAQVRKLLSQALPAMDGRGLRVTVLEVSYGPGGSSRPHRHPCAVVGSVIAGTLRSRVEGEPEALYRAGESFYEAPNGVHAVSANASDRDPVRFLAYFTCDHDAPLSEEVP